MEDINNMSIKDFARLNDYIKKRESIRNNKPIPLKTSQKDMIKRSKEKRGI